MTRKTRITITDKATGDIRTAEYDGHLSHGMLDDLKRSALAKGKTVTYEHLTADPRSEVQRAAAAAWAEAQAYFAASERHENGNYAEYLRLAKLGRDAVETFRADYPDAAAIKDAHADKSAADRAARVASSHVANRRD